MATGSDTQPIQVRDMPRQVVRQLERHADAAGMSREAYIRQLLIDKAQEPVISPHYGIRAATRDNAQVVIISRTPEATTFAVAPQGSALPDHLQQLLMNTVVPLLILNGPGAKEQAIGILTQHFVQVYEVAV